MGRSSLSLSLFQSSQLSTLSLLFTAFVSPFSPDILSDLLSLSLSLSKPTMISSKPKSGLSEASAQKITPATPRVNKLGRAGSTKSDPILVSPQQNPDRRSPKSVDSKPAIDRRSPRTTTTTTTTPDKQPRASKVPELQAQLGVVQEDLKKAREQLALVEIEKSRTLEELNDAKKLADEVNEKLKEALVAQSRAEESLEIENFRADELEQAGIDAAQKRDAQWKTELEGIREQHNADLAALISATQELARVKQELAISSDEKNNAVNNADDSMKIAEVNARKAELLSDEVRYLMGLLDSEIEAKSGESTELVKKLGSEVAALKQELERSRASDGKLAEMEELVDALHAEVDEAKRSESDAGQLVGEWKKKVELLEARVEEAIHSEMSSQDSLSTAMKQLEEGYASLQDAESEISVLKGKVESLEIEVARYEADLEESNHSLGFAQESLELGRKVEALESEVQELEEASTQALNKEKAVTAARIESLSEERNKLIHELEIARDEGEKSKRAMEGLASALHEVSMEARETQERLLMKQSEVESAHDQMEELKGALVNGRESYEVMLDEAKYEIVCLQKTIERSEEEFETMKGEWVAKELSYARGIKRLEEEPASIKTEMDKMVILLNEAQITKEDNAQLLSKLKNAESDAKIIDEVVQEAKGENLQLRERLLDKENALQSITQENDELRIREAAALDKIKELSALLAEASAKNSEGNGALSYGEKEYPLAKEVEIPVLNAIESGKPYESFTVVGKPDEKPNGNFEKEETLEDFSSEREHEDESIDDESDSKMESMSLDQVSGLPNEKIDNGTTSPTKRQPQRKKKPLLQKFGSLLKKKSNQK